MSKSNHKEYQVNVVYTMVHTMWVTADDAEDAKDKAMAQFCDEPDFSDDEIDEVLHANIVYDHDAPTYPVRYKGCVKSGCSVPDDPKFGRIEYWTMEQILDEINRDRSEGWIPYDEVDWKEGLAEFTEWEPVEEGDKPC